MWKQEGGIVVKKYYGIIIWFLLMALTLFLVFIIPSQYTKQIWTVVVFDIIAFASQLLTWFMRSKNAQGTFYKYPTIAVSTVYLILQFVISTVVAIANEAVPFKVLFTINFVLLVIMWLIILSALMARDKIESLGSRQKDHHIEL